MRMLIFLQGLGIGAVGRQVSMLADHLAMRGHQVSVVALHTRDPHWKWFWSSAAVPVDMSAAPDLFIDWWQELPEDSLGYQGDGRRQLVPAPQVRGSWAGAHPGKCAIHRRHGSSPPGSGRRRNACDRRTLTRIGIHRMRVLLITTLKAAILRTGGRRPEESRMISRIEPPTGKRPSGSGA